MGLNESLLKELTDQKQALDQSAIVAATDRSGTITYVNDKFVEISGYSAAELLGQNHRILNSGLHDDLFFVELWKTISSGQVWHGEICNRAKLGHHYWVKTTIVPFLGEDGRPYQYLSIRHDITALKQAEKTIMSQQEKLVASSKLTALGELSAAITHEINNPLGVILGRCEMLKACIEDESLNRDEIRRLVDSIEITGMRIDKIVKSMRSFTRNEEGEAVQLCSVADIVNGALDLTTIRFRDHGIKFNFKINPENIQVNCRPTQILQVLVNLLNNSHDAVEKMADPWVLLSVDIEDGHIYFRIRDSGSGLNAEVEKKIFTPFFTTKDIQYGTGLGLSISKSIAKKHRGDLLYEKVEGHTQFTLTFPV
jgi:PAS domain S-box-containing protein